MSCLVTSATRISRTDPPAVVMASTAASSQEEGLVPITSGVLDRRPQLDGVLGQLRPGDTLVV